MALNGVVTDLNRMNPQPPLVESPNNRKTRAPQHMEPTKKSFSFILFAVRLIIECYLSVSLE